MGRPKWWPDVTLPGRLEVKGLEITYQFIFLSARSGNIKSVKKIKKIWKNRFFFFAGFAYRSDVSAFS